MANKSDLAAYPRPSLAVDVALLTVVPRADDDVPGQLAVLIQERDLAPSGQVLPGRFLRERQTLRDAVADVLRLKVGLDVPEVSPRLLRVFDDPHRDERAWTISVAHALAFPYEEAKRAAGEFVGIDANGDLASGETLLFDHDLIVREASIAMRARYEHRPDPDGLLAANFTLAELRALHEAVLGEPLLKDTFNRRMVEHVEPVMGQDRRPLMRSRGGRPAQVYTRVGEVELSPSAQRRLLLPRATS